MDRYSLIAFGVDSWEKPTWRERLRGRDKMLYMLYLEGTIESLSEGESGEVGVEYGKTTLVMSLTDGTYRVSEGVFEVTARDFSLKVELQGLMEGETQGAVSHKLAGEHVVTVHHEIIEE